MEGGKEHHYVPIWRSCRGQLAVCGTVGFVFMYLLRINLSVAMVCMVKQPLLRNTTMFNMTLPSGFNTTMETPEEDTLCGELEKKRRTTDQGEFEWSKPMQGYVLSSFYYGYIITQVPGGWLASQFGGKHVLGSGLLLSIVATLFIPIAARAHVGLLIGLRIIMGLGMGMVFPAMHALIGCWSPPMERTKITAFTYAGTMVGTVGAMYLSGLLCVVPVDNGWPLIFYIFGGAGLFWYISWLFLAYSSPGSHPRISESEILYIHETVGAGGSSSNRSHKTPWLSIASSPPVWAIVVAHACNNWGGYTILSCIPMYMREVLKFNIKQNGLLSALPYICMYLLALFLSVAVDAIRSRHILSTTVVRKICQVFSFGVPCVLIAVMGFMDCTQRVGAVALLTVSVSFLAFGRCGYSVSHIDIAPRYAGILFGISNTVATIPGMVAPVVAGALTQHGSQEEWQRVFFICSGVYAFGLIFFIVFASGEIQTWAVSPDFQPSKDREITPMNEYISASSDEAYPDTDFTAGHEKQSLKTGAL